MEYNRLVILPISGAGMFLQPDTQNGNGSRMDVKATQSADSAARGGTLLIRR
jgi:hypothetical protein